MCPFISQRGRRGGFYFARQLLSYLGGQQSDPYVVSNNRMVCFCSRKSGSAKVIVRTLRTIRQDKHR